MDVVGDVESDGAGITACTCVRIRVVEGSPSCSLSIGAIRRKPGKIDGWIAGRERERAGSLYSIPGLFDSIKPMCRSYFPAALAPRFSAPSTSFLLLSCSLSLRGTNALRSFRPTLYNSISVIDSSDFSLKFLLEF